MAKSYIQLPEGNICAIANELVTPGDSYPITKVDGEDSNSRTRLEAKVMWVADLAGNLDGTVALTEIGPHGDIATRNVPRGAFDKYTLSTIGYLTMMVVQEQTLN